MWKKKWPSKPKFGNKKVENAGYSFGSKLESALFSLLKSREAAGEIRNIRVQVRIPLTLARIVYITDFTYELTENGETEAAESKGFSTDVFAIKKRLYKFYGPYKLNIYTGSYKNIQLTEVIIPKGE